MGGRGGGIVALLIYLAILVAVIAGVWKTFEKADEPGWAAIIPIYNPYVLVKISGNDWWWLILFFIPVLTLLAGIKIGIDIAKAFGQGLGLFFLGFVFFPLLGFGEYRYEGSSVSDEARGVSGEGGRRATGSTSSIVTEPSSPGVGAGQRFAWSVKSATC